MNKFIHIILWQKVLISIQWLFVATTSTFVLFCILLLLHFTIIGTYSWFLNLCHIQIRFFVFFIQGLAFISYPLIGLLADVKLTRYRMICLSCWVTFVSHLLLLLVVLCLGLPYSIHHDGPFALAIVSSIIVLIPTTMSFVIVGKGMFESTVIQFGTDQMIEASSAQLSTFIHWYYWSMYVGDFCINIIIAAISGLLSHCFFPLQNLHEHGAHHRIRSFALWTFTVPVIILQCILCCFTLLLLYLKKVKSYLNIEPVGVNAVRKVIDVLKYAYHHKYPVRRSALSYYRNTYPSRIDFGKVQYGGPFTNEEVEDTKTVLRLSVLLLSLFGFHLSSDGFSTTNHILSKSCPSSLMLLVFISNPSFISDVITLVGIPVFHLFIKSSLGKYFPNMLKRMWFGLLLLCLHELCSLIVNIEVDYHKCDFWVLPNKTHDPSTVFCYYSLIEYSNTTQWNTTDCVNICPSSLYTMDSTLMWLLVPHILHGFGYMLVFVSVLEFICAQAPFRLKGFMIGIWYTMFSIKYIIIDITDDVISYFQLEERTWIIYESIKIGIIGLSLIIFGISCQWYRYRERDEVVNVQGMIEDIFEKELLQQENEDENASVVSSQTNYSTFDN